MVYWENLWFPLNQSIEMKNWKFSVDLGKAGNS